MNFLKKARKALGHASGVEPLVRIEISKKQIIRNLIGFEQIAQKSQKNHGDGSSVAPVLKSNAYGHGLFEVAHILERQGASIPFFIVDSYFEARVLRSCGIRKPLLIIGYCTAEMMRKNRLPDIRFTISTIEMAREITAQESARKKIIIHLKIDTGMHRQGLRMDGNEIDEAIALIKKSPFIELEGICSHFAESENEDAAFTNEQILVWNRFVKKMRAEFPILCYWHISNTAGHSHLAKIDSNLTRLGIGLYENALSMTTVISGIKKIRAGESVGYSRTFIAAHDMTIATIPVGYYEGVDRRLSNKGVIKINGVHSSDEHFSPFAPIIGRVSMNITTINVSAFPNLKQGDPVTVISADPADLNSINGIARLCDTIPYEILAHIPSHLKRIIK